MLIFSRINLIQLWLYLLISELQPMYTTKQVCIDGI